MANCNVFAEIKLNKMGSYWIRVGSHPMTHFLIETWTPRKIGKKATWQKRPEGYSYKSRNAKDDQPTPGAGSKHLFPPLELSDRIWPYPNLDFRFLVSSGERIQFCCLKSSICCNFFYGGYRKLKVTDKSLPHSYMNKNLDRKNIKCKMKP